MGESISDVVMGLLSAALGLLGLFLVSGSRDSEMTVFGYGLALFGVLFVFGRISSHYSRREARATLVGEGHPHG